MKTIPCILIDTETNTEYPPMSRREAADIVGCSKSTLCNALKGDYLINGRYKVRDGEGPIESKAKELDSCLPPNFPDEWNEARVRVLKGFGKNVVT